MRDPRIKCDCPFCGEAVHLRVHDGGGLLPIVFENGAVRGADTIEEVLELDAIHCDVCWSNAAIEVWNREVPAEVMAVLRDIDPAELEAA